MAAGYVLSEDDVRILRDTVRIVKLLDGRGDVNANDSRFTDRGQEDHQAPETYVVVPESEDGIEGLQTGAGLDGEDIPGEGACKIYRVSQDILDEPILQELQKKITVYNLGGAVSQAPALATRDKFGKWILAQGGGAGSDFFWFTIQNLDCESLCATVRVDIASCNATVDVGDEVRVYDPVGVFFNAYTDVLVGERGWASKAVFEPDPCDLDDGYPPGEGCYWMVMDMICQSGGC